MNEQAGEPAVEHGWVVQADQPALSESATTAAAAMQATLGLKLAELRARREPFPDGAGPAAAEQWIAEGGRPDGRGDLRPRLGMR